MVEGSGFHLGVVGSLALSVASSVAIVICNKALMSSLGFPFATTLTSWHLMVTFCTLHVAQRLHFFEPKAIDGRTIVLFGFLNGTSIGLLNLSLGFNSIGFYQMTKLAIIPFTVMLETVFLNKKFSRSIKISLLILLLGVGIASITDLKLNLLGSILSLLAIATTCVGQIVSFDCPYFIFYNMKAIMIILFKGYCSLLFYLTLYKDDKHNTKETEGLIHPAAVPVLTLPSSYLICYRPFCRQVPHQQECFCPQLLFSCRGTSFANLSVSIFVFYCTYLHMTL